MPPPPPPTSQQPPTSLSRVASGDVAAVRRDSWCDRIAQRTRRALLGGLALTPTLTLT